MKVRILAEILDEVGDFGRTKNDILDNVFLVSIVIDVLTIVVSNSGHLYHSIVVTCG